MANTASLDLTTALQDVSSFGSQRQIGVSGGSANLIVDIYASDDSTHTTTLVRVARINGPSRLVSLVDSSPALKYVLVQGTFAESGGVWIQAVAASDSFAIDILTTPTDVSALLLFRQILWVGASVDFFAEVYALASTKQAIVQTIVGPSGYAPVPEDTSTSMKYVVVRGSLQGGKIWVQGSETMPS